MYDSLLQQKRYLKERGAAFSRLESDGKVEML